MRGKKPPHFIVVVIDEDLDLQGVEQKPFLLEIE